MSFPAVNSEGNTIDLRSLGASSPLSVPQDPLDMETSSVGASQLSAEPSPSPRFVNLDAEDATELPTGLDDALQPVLPDEVRGMLAALQEEWVRIGGDVDWPQVDDTFQLRAVTSHNHQVAVIGQCIGVAAPSGEECARCRRSVGCFASCRVVAFRESSVKSTVVSLGSCMCCHFAGVARACSLRVDAPAWALDALRVHSPEFQFPAVTPTHKSPAQPPTQPTTPSTPPRSAASRFLSSVSTRLSRKRPRISPSAADVSPSPHVESSEELSEEGAPITPKWRSVLTRGLFEASPDVRLRMERRLTEEIAQMQVNIGLVRRDLRGLESLRGQEAVERASSGGGVDAVWADHVADL
ncbi:hypothetical protein N7449_008061 [Penicillium cf. viridicatum]|uniref:Uncharacterized protein n=1 Tax=Penicillium cf. viridicatum TaxID=2972119 RepID=A0A9W9JJK1_9EURO|nr:hypothetical protein N7449_011111 [Penicillium cf. viridicatum]KAJ5197582.1 hypothetical protein N7449_008061 [Penicillium cf. viridicatum]